MKTPVGQMGQSVRGSSSATSAGKHGGLIVEISSSTDACRSLNSLDSSPPKAKIYLSNTHKRLSSHDSEKLPVHVSKRRRDDGSSTITVESTSSSGFSARLTKSSSVYNLDQHRSTLDLKDDLPKSIREQLERWYTRYGRSVPPCASFTHVQSSKGDNTCEWQHVPSGERLQVSTYFMNKVNDPKPSQGNAKRLIIAQGRIQGPFIVQFVDGASRRKGLHISRFRIWHGVDSGSAGYAGDRNGFEHVPSVTKTTFQRGSPAVLEVSDDEDDEPLSAQVPRSRRTIVVARPQLTENRDLANHGYRPCKRTRSDTGSVLPASKGLVAGASVERSPGCSDVLRRPKKSLPSPAPRLGPASNHHLEHTSTVPPFDGLSSPEFRQEPQSSSSTDAHRSSPTDAQLESLSQHIRTNTEFWFMPLHDKHPPRLRPYNVCNTAKLLFGHARSARVFDPSPEIANVLSLRLWDKTEAMTLMEEDDLELREHDYQGFLMSLSDSKCWIWIQETWTGTCNVEVKVMQ